MVVAVNVPLTLKLSALEAVFANVAYEALSIDPNKNEAVKANDAVVAKLAYDALVEAEAYEALVAKIAYDELSIKPEPVNDPLREPLKDPTNESA